MITSLLSHTKILIYRISKNYQISNEKNKNKNLGKGHIGKPKISLKGICQQIYIAVCNQPNAGEVRRSKKDIHRRLQSTERQRRTTEQKRYAAYLHTISFEIF
uniref:Uncharacterized protein n=1 Tax=Solanum lycopersicum TaxID=4081 RepID=K4CXN2_SOLLC